MAAIREIPIVKELLEGMKWAIDKVWDLINKIIPIKDMLHTIEEKLNPLKSDVVQQMKKNAEGKVDELKNALLKEAMDTLHKYMPDLPKLKETDHLGKIKLPDGIKVWIPDGQFGFQKAF